MNRLCPLCETLVETHYPGISYIRVEGQLYHPKCHESETGETADDRDDLLMHRLKKSLAVTTNPRVA